MKKKIFESLCLLIPAGVVGIACILGLSLHPVELAEPEKNPELSQASNAVSETSSVTEAVRTDDISNGKGSLPESTEISKSENSTVQDKQNQQSSRSTESAQTSKREKKQVSGSSAVQTHVSGQEVSGSANQQTSSAQSAADTGNSQTEQTSQRQPEQSRTEASHTAEPSRQEIRQTVSAPVQQSSTAPVITPQVSEEISYAPEVPAGRYIDGTYTATAEVDGFEEEGFLYDLEVTVTISGGEIASISGRIINDRSEDPSSNEAYVRRAVKKLSDTIIANQGTSGVDVISNATYSSNAVLRAVSDLLAQVER